MTIAKEIDALAKKYEWIANAIYDDPEWFVDEGIDDSDIADGLMIAAKALRSGKVKP